MRQEETRTCQFIYGKNRYLTPYLKQLFCNGLIQPHFDYACSAWYPNLYKKFKELSPAR